MEVEIDKLSGFCFGVEQAITTAENILKENGEVYCLGDMVHNNREMERLKSLGLITVDHETFKNLRNCRVLIRAHGEPPETYKIAEKNNIQLIDCTCPIVELLQKKIKSGYKEMNKKDGQVVIFGKEEHAEVIGLKGQAEGKVIVVNQLKDLDQIDFSKPIDLFTQTTRNNKKYEALTKEISKRIKGNKKEKLKINNTICGQVANHEPHIRKFANKHDLILFVSGKNSSNGKMLYQACKEENPYSYFISSESEIEKKWFNKIRSVGICGATSTPEWLMNNVAKKVGSLK